MRVTLRSMLRRRLLTYFAGIASNFMLSKAIQEYLQRSGMPHMSDEELSALEAPLSADEMALAIARIRPGPQASGPDGYSLLYYKTFGDLLTPHFLKAYNTDGKGVTPPRRHTAGLHCDEVSAYLTKLCHNIYEHLLNLISHYCNYLIFD